MQEFELLSLSHFLGFSICLAAIVFIPKAIQSKPGLENFSKYEQTYYSTFIVVG